MNVPRDHAYLPPLNNPQLLPSQKVLLELWREHKMHLYLLLYNKSFQQFAQTLLQLWLNDFCLIDPLFLSQWYSFAKSSLFFEYLPKIPKHIQLWNHYDARCLALFATHRWSCEINFERNTLPKVPMRLKPIEHTTEGFIRRWGNLPEFKDLPVPLNFSMNRSWPVPWRLLYRGLITAALYPNDCFLVYQDWEGWSWISGWIQWAGKTMGSSTASIYPEVAMGELRQPCLHQTRMGLAVGWEIMDRIMQFRQLPNRSTQDWLMKRFRLSRKVWLSPYLYGSEDFSQRHLNLLYSYTEWVSWTILYPERMIENSRHNQNYLKQHEAEHINDYMTMGQMYHQTACQDRSSSKIQSEFINLQEQAVSVHEKQNTKPVRSSVSIRMESTTRKNTEKQPKQNEVVEKEETNVIDGYIPRKGELDYRVRDVPKRKQEVEKTLHVSQKRDTRTEEIETGEEEEDNFDWGEMEEWVVRKNISNENRSEEEEVNNDILSG